MVRTLFANVCVGTKRVATVGDFLTVGSFRNVPTVNHDAIDRGYHLRYKFHAKVDGGI